MNGPIPSPGVVTKTWEKIIKYCKSNIRQFPSSIRPRYRHFQSIEFVLKTFQFYDFPLPYRYYSTGGSLILDCDDYIGPPVRIYLEFSGEIDAIIPFGRVGCTDFNKCDYLNLRSKLVSWLF